MKEHNNYLSTSKAYYDQRFGREAIQHTPLNTEELQRLSYIDKEVKNFAMKRGRSKINILDYGCGRGWLSNELTKYGYVTGIDLSEEAIKVASQKYPIVNFICVDASSTEPVDLKAKFDIIVSSEVIEHVQEQELYFENMLQLLSDENSLLLLTTPNGRWREYYFYGDRKTWGQPYENWLKKERLLNYSRGKFNKITVSTFGSGWIFLLRSFGLPNLLGNRFLYKIIRIFKLKHLYEKILNQLGFGLYLLFKAER